MHVKITVLAVELNSSLQSAKTSTAYEYIENEKSL
jgi:hypothetical protein